MRRQGNVKVGTGVNNPSVITEEFKTGRSESCRTMQNNTNAAAAVESLADAFQFKIEITNKTLDSNSTIVLSQKRE